MHDHLGLSLGDGTAHGLRVERIRDDRGRTGGAERRQLESAARHSNDVVTISEEPGHELPPEHTGSTSNQSPSWNHLSRGQFAKDGMTRPVAETAAGREWRRAQRAWCVT